LRLCLLGLRGVDEAQEFNLINIRYKDPRSRSVAIDYYLYTDFQYMTARFSDSYKAKRLRIISKSNSMGKESHLPRLFNLGYLNRHS